MPPLASAPATALEEQSRDFYRAALGQLDKHKLPYLVGGAYAFARYTGFERHTNNRGRTNPPCTPDSAPEPLPEGGVGVGGAQQT